MNATQCFNQNENTRLKDSKILFLFACIFLAFLLALKKEVYLPIGGKVFLSTAHKTEGAMSEHMNLASAKLKIKVCVPG